MLCFWFIFQLCALFFFSLSLATSEKSSHWRCSIDRKITVSEQAWNFIKRLLRKGTPVKYFPMIFTKLFRIPLKLIFPGAWSNITTWSTHNFEFFFLVTYPMFIYWFFSSLWICFCPTYQVITIIQINLTLTQFVFHVCWLNKLPPGILFWINELMQVEEKMLKLQWMFYPWFREKN